MYASKSLPFFRQIVADVRYYRERDGVGLLGVLLCPALWICLSYRFGNALTRVRIPVLGRPLRAFYVILNFAISSVTQADIRCGANIGQRFDIHTYRGLLITNGVIIGDDVSINAQVAIVNKCNDCAEGVAVIGNGVRLGIGCKVLGGVRIGDGAQVGANAVVVGNVPAGHLAVGVPAVIKPRRKAELHDVNAAPA